jgi:hypothetical protein
MFRRHHCFRTIDASTSSAVQLHAMIIGGNAPSLYSTANSKNACLGSSDTATDGGCSRPIIDHRAQWAVKGRSQNVLSMARSSINSRMPPVCFDCILNGSLDISTRCDYDFIRKLAPQTFLSRHNIWASASFPGDTNFTLLEEARRFLSTITL